MTKIYNFIAVIEDLTLLFPRGIYGSKDTWVLNIHQMNQQQTKTRV